LHSRSLLALLLLSKKENKLNFHYQFQLISVTVTIMPKLTESFLRQRSAELLVEKIAGATVFDKDQEQKIPLFNPKGKHQY
jgi:hypothetical protein